MISRLLLPAMVMASMSCHDGDSKKIIASDNAPAAIGPYSQAVGKNDVLYISGQIALTPDGSMDTATFDNECRRVLANIGHLLEAGGKQVQDVCKVTVYMTDLSQYAAFNRIYSDYFTGDYPAREVVQVEGLPRRAHIEMSLIAD